MAKTLFALVMSALMLASGSASAQELKMATLAGGCFWCVEADFDRIPGVVETVSGYTGGSVAEPTYKQVSAGGTGHREAVQIIYDPGQVTYEELLIAFWYSFDPTDAGGQYCDRGHSYTTAVFVNNPNERQAAEASKQAAANELGREIVTPIEDAGSFYPAEEYHQDYYQKSTLRYGYYRWACGRDARVRELWGESAYRGISGHE